MNNSGADYITTGSLQKRLLKPIIDSLLVVACLLTSVALHKGEVVLSRECLIWAVLIVLLRISANIALGVYRSIWRYFGLSEASVLVRSFLLATVLLLAGQYVAAKTGVFPHARTIPVEILVMEFFMSLSATLTARAATKFMHERRERTYRGRSAKSRRVVLYGAGRAGMLLYKELKGNSDFEVVGFVDDDPRKQGAVIVGLPILGDYTMLESIVKQNKIDEIVICVAAGYTTRLSEVVLWCKKSSVPVKIIPSLEELVDHQVKIGQLREIQIEDLLGRQSLNGANWGPEMMYFYEGQRILVTGAGGSIGSELVRQLLSFRPEKLALVDRDENSLYEIEQEIRFRFSDPPIEPIVADIRDPRRMASVFETVRPDWVFHAAAYKHVPLMEMHACEAVLNNVGGTLTLLETSRQFEVKHFVFISTDKAVNPTSVLGLTKLIGEKLVQLYSRSGGPAASSVRFGNVAGSRGSVIPLFKNQIAKGGPLTITHPEIVRFFMTIPEAVQLVLCAGTLGGDGSVFVLDMGNARKVLELARDIITLSGLVPDKDIPIVFTGLRPGEKLYEELTSSSETTAATRFERISQVCEHGSMPVSLSEVEKLRAAAANVDAAQALKLLKCICEKYIPSRPTTQSISAASVA